MFDTPTTSVGKESRAVSIYDLSGVGQVGEDGAFTAPGFGAPRRLESGLMLYAGVNAGYGYNDNLLSAPSNTLESSYYAIQPALMAEAKKGGDRYTLGYTGNFTRYTDTSNDDFNNHQLALAGDNRFTTKSTLGWTLGYAHGVDPRGSTDRPQSAEPDRWGAWNARAMYGYGSAGAQGRIELEGNATRKRYDNNLIYTEAGDGDLMGLSGRFIYRVMPKTSAVLEARHAVSDYSLGTSTNDNSDQRYLVGVVWDATAKTSGSFKLGYMNRDYDQASKPSASGSTWEGGIKWSPLTYSVFDLKTVRTVNDSTGLGNFIHTTDSTLAWNHVWVSRFSSRLSLGYGKDDYDGIARNDTRSSVGAGVFYALRPNLRTGLEYSHVERDSDLSGYDYTRNTALLSLSGTL